MAKKAYKPHLPPTMRLHSFVSYLVSLFLKMITYLTLRFTFGSWSMVIFKNIVYDPQFLLEKYRVHHGPVLVSILLRIFFVRNLRVHIHALLQPDIHRTADYDFGRF